MARDKVKDIEFLAKRYNKLPSDILKLDVKELQFNLFAANIAIMDEAAQARKQAAARSKRG